jgi:transglutaminase-like putative cysteine protease
MFLLVRHQTRFRYEFAVQESLMDVRKHPRNDGLQRVLSFDLLVRPKARLMQYRDHLGNLIHHFSVPGKHAQLQIIAEARVETMHPAAAPDRLEPSAWNEIDALVEATDYWEFLMPSDFARPAPYLNELAESLNIVRRDDPLTLLMDINSGIYRSFEYVPKSTGADSPIDLALRTRRGVCQDFAHIAIAMIRQYLRIPCRYVSGYLFHGRFDHDRSVDGATHAWLEALLPGLGWVGFDPTNDLVVGERHIRTAIGRDYADVPPTHGTFKGSARSELFVSVQVAQTEVPAKLEEETLPPIQWPPIPEDDDETIALREQQQQQQQQ